VPVERSGSMWVCRDHIDDAVKRRDLARSNAGYSKIG